MWFSLMTLDKDMYVTEAGYFTSKQNTLSSKIDISALKQFTGN